MNKLFIAIFSLSILFNVSCKKTETKVNRQDNALKITNCYPQSCQNPCFSPNGEYLIYTRFINGYNISPSEIVKIKVDGTNEQIIVTSANSGNVNVPYGSWVENKICFASDRAGMADEIWIVNDDGTNLTQITSHSEDDGVYFIEPVFNPKNNNQIVFEYVEGEDDKTAIHKIAYLNVLTSKITLLTNGNYDDRLPSWNNNGNKILFQRNEYGRDEGWKVYIADIDTENIELNNIRILSYGYADYTDCSWSYNDEYIISSSMYDNISVPNIWMFPLDTNNSLVRITNNNTYEDGAPTQSHSGNKIAFESHYGDTEEQSSEIWIINSNYEKNK